MNDVAIRSLIAADTEIVARSSKALLVVSFGKSSSRSYKSAMELAKSAIWYIEKIIGGEVIHAAAYDDSRQAASQAVSLLKIVQAWKSTVVHAGGRIIPYPMYAWQTLECYLASFAASDYRAHCLVLAPCDQEPGLENKHLLPCRRVLGHEYLLSKFHPSSLKDQVQGLGVRNCCEWCPRFNSQNYRFVMPQERVDSAN